MKNTTASAPAAVAHMARSPNGGATASLFADEDGKSFNLIWSRARTSNGN
jgi:hypothetical protein